MQFDIPYIPDRKYTDFITSLNDKIFSVHFSLYSDEISDARQRFHAYETEFLAESLGEIGSVKKYLILNGRFYHPDLYFSEQKLSSLIKKINLFLDKGCISGLIYSDSYLLSAIGQFSPKTANDLEAIPSVNCMIDSYEKLMMNFDAIESSGFKIPSKVILDRSLNRRIDDLSFLSSELRKQFKNIKIGLIANEGCIPECPFKPAHDSHVSYSNIHPQAERTFSLNRNFGCVNLLNKSPWLSLASPFIRPEDAGFYSGCADIIKICGRNLGREFLIKTVSAYTDESFSGNLFGLMDALDWFAEIYKLENKKITSDFVEKVTSCNHICRDCTYCRDLFKMISELKSDDGLGFIR